MTRQALLSALCGISLLVAPAARAATIKPYTQAAYNAALQNGTPLVVHVEASWCPTCKAQQEVLKSLEADPRYAKVEILDVDFDAQKPVVRQLHVQMQSTLIAYHDGTEAARVTGITSKADIERLLNYAVKG